jgi:hypothetical protein
LKLIDPNNHFNNNKNKNKQRASERGPIHKLSKFQKI